MSYLNPTHALFLALAIPSLAAAAITSPVVDLGYAKYSGYNNVTSGINYFRGIPYAQAPVGDLRWRKPQPIESSNNFTGATINASVAAPACYNDLPGYVTDPLYTAALALLPQSEDCLVLDVYVPQNQTATSPKKLPVMVTIHGGGYNAGSAASNPGDAMVHQANGGLIYISIQYRLGMFGFLAGPEISGDGVANAGLLDQRLALDWIQRHIGQFGGDPSKVTIWGGSAGGGSVIYQMIANGGDDLPPFRAAIAEYPWMQPMMSPSSQSIQYRAVLDVANCTNLECLRSLSSAALATVQSSTLTKTYPSPGYAYGTFGFAPVVDGVFIRGYPLEELKKGHFHKVPLITDRDLNEGTGVDFSNINSTLSEDTDAQSLFPSAGPSFYSRLYELYPSGDFNSSYLQRGQWFGDFVVKCPSYTLASAALDNLKNSSQVFKLIFSAGTTQHAASLPFLTDTDINFGDAPNVTIAQIMTSYWISFATTLDPNILRTANAPFWPSYVDGGNVTATGVADYAVGFNILEVFPTSFVTLPDIDRNGRCDFLSSKEVILRN